MAESESQEGDYDNRRDKIENLKTDMEELLKKMGKLTECATWISYNYITIRSNPDLHNAVQHLENAFLMGQEEIKKK